ncbi:MFS transporter [Corynebacterium sp. Marseille-P4321]|uniref:MFS transporter n=1 Tax=Corynebacterium sp. Marseille-P4321 TaxID=2736603 RepID=UPI0034C60936
MKTSAFTAWAPHLKPAATNPWSTLAALAAGYFVFLLDQGFMPVVAPLLPFDVGDAVWLTSVYLLCSVAPMPAAGRVGDALGQRRVFLAGLAAYAVALALAAVAPSLAWLVVARGLQGLGVALFLPQAFALIPRVFAETGRAFAVWGIVGSIASLLAPPLAGAVAQAWGWRAAFGVQAVLALVALVFAAVWVPKLPGGGARVAALPVVLSFAGLGTLVYGIQFGSAASVGVGLSALAVLVASARVGQDQGFLPLGLLRDRRFALGTLAISTMGFVAASMFIPLMFWLQTVAGTSPTAAGLIAMPLSVAALMFTPLAGRLTDNGSPATLSAAGFALQAAALAIAAWMMKANASVGWFAAVMGAIGIGGAFVWTPNAALTLGAAEESDAGAASGLYNTARQVGSVVGVAATGAVLASGDVAVTAAPALALSAVASVVGAVASISARLAPCDLRH